MANLVLKNDEFQIASMAPEANRAERDAANAVGVDASAVAADHIALDIRCGITSSRHPSHPSTHRL